MLEVRHLSVAYGQHRALDDVSVKIAKGEVVVILGANGAGKSSLLRAVAGLSEGHCEGDITFQGTTILGSTPDHIVTSGIALVPEGRAIFGDLNVEENLRLGAYNDRARANEAANLDRVLTLFPKLRERRKQITRTMSGGEQQMVAIGRALMSDPSILMLDEPSLGLSPILSKELFQALGHIRETGPGVLVVEQNAKLSLAIADRGYLIENGHIVGENDAAALSADPSVQAAYLGGSAKTVSRQVRASAAPPSPPAVSTPASPQPNRTYVTPAGLSASSAATSSLIGENLDGLLGRASQAAQQRPTPDQLVSQAATAAPPPKGPRVIEVVPEALPTTQASTSSALVTGARHGSGQDDRIAGLLADFEQAAARARQPYGSAAGHPAGDQSAGGQPAGSQNGSGPGSRESLPHIPVFRKSKVEVFKRDGDGMLVKSKEV